MGTVRDQLHRARTDEEITEALTGCGVEAAELARLDADATPGASEPLQVLRDVAIELSETLTGTGVGQWLHASNRLLGGATPLDAFAAGDVAGVRGAAASFVDGSYL